jgi:hypothetical protein
MTFDLPPSQIFNKSTAETFAKSVRLAIAELDDKYHPPAKALEYRAKRFEALDPRFEVKADLIDDVVRYSVGARPGQQAKLRIVAKSEEDSKKIQSAIEYGTKVNIKGKLKGSPIVQHDESVESHLALTPKARDFRLGISTSLMGIASTLSCLRRPHSALGVPRYAPLIQSVLSKSHCSLIVAESLRRTASRSTTKFGTVSG